MGLIRSDSNNEIDYMLGSIIYCLLIKKNKNKNSLKILKDKDIEKEESGSLNLLYNSKNNNIGVQSARNWKRSSETICQLSDINFFKWLAGIIDGDGNFDIRVNKKTKKKYIGAIRIKLHNRDIRILNRIQDKLHIGNIRKVKNTPYSVYSIYSKEDMIYLINNINGVIRLKVKSFKLACLLLDIPFIIPNYILEHNSPYFSGLIDTDGSIVFNYNSNRIECNLELKYNEFSHKLNFDNVISDIKPSVYFRVNKNQSIGKTFQSIAFKYQTVDSMIPVYNYFMCNRLYSDFKFFRVTRIPLFLKIRHYKKFPFESKEFKVYSIFLKYFISHRNPLWFKVPFIQNLNIR